MYALVKFALDLIDTYIKSYNSLKDIDFTLVFTDFYMICRMFMNFDKNKKTEGCLQGNNNYVIRYSVIYGRSTYYRFICIF